MSYGYLDLRRLLLADGRVPAFTAAFCWRRASAAIIPRAAPAQALAALSQILSSGFFFVHGFAMAPPSMWRSGNGVVFRHPRHLGKSAAG